MYIAMQLFKKTERKTSRNLRPSFASFILAIILGLSFLLVLAENFKACQSTVSILFIPRNEKTAGEIEYIMANATKIPRMLSFYEKMISENPTISDNFSGYEKDKKKEKWNDILALRRENGSLVTELSISGKDPGQAELAALAAARTLFRTLSFYYNIKEDVDFRIIDGPITKNYVSNWPVLAVIVIIFVLITSFFIEKISLKISGIILAIIPRAKKERKPAKETPSFKKTVEIPFGKSETKTAGDWIKKSAAPENLPVFQEKSSRIIEETMGYKPEAEKPGDFLEDEETPEPTNEELKKRLNQLLRGEL
jgi:hypothetical protein